MTDRLEIVIVPSGSVPVTITRRDPGTATFYAAPTGGSPITFPDTITARKSYYVEVDPTSAAPRSVDARGTYRVTGGASPAELSLGDGAPPVIEVAPPTGGGGGGGGWAADAYRGIHVDAGPYDGSSKSVGRSVMPTPFALGYGTVEWAGTVVVPANGFLSVEFLGGSSDQAERTVGYAYLEITRVADLAGVPLTGPGDVFTREQNTPGEAGAGFLVFDTDAPDDAHYAASDTFAVTLVDGGTYVVYAGVDFSA